jgi:hypothetical protein
MGDTAWVTFWTQFWQTAPVLLTILVTAYFNWLKSKEALKKSADNAEAIQQVHGLVNGTNSRLEAKIDTLQAAAAGEPERMRIAEQIARHEPKTGGGT